MEQAMELVDPYAVEGDFGPRRLNAEKFAELIVQDYAKKKIQRLMRDPSFVQAMDEHYEEKWAHRFD
jgi:hypothetical protein